MHRDTFNRIVIAQWEEMGDVGSARYEPTLLPLLLAVSQGARPYISVEVIKRVKELHKIRKV